MAEIVPIYNKYSKDPIERKNVKIDDIVVLLEKRDREKGWPVGKVVEITESHDGLVRKAKILAKGKTMERAKSV